MMRKKNDSIQPITISNGKSILLTAATTVESDDMELATQLKDRVSVWQYELGISMLDISRSLSLNFRRIYSALVHIRSFYSNYSLHFDE